MRSFFYAVLIMVPSLMIGMALARADTEYPDGSGSVETQKACGPERVVEKDLKKRFGELPFLRYQFAGSTWLMFVNPKTGTWTSGVRKGNGVFCVRLFGVDAKPHRGGEPA